jgi:hypothetical protein
MQSDVRVSSVCHTYEGGKGPGDPARGALDRHTGEREFRRSQPLGVAAPEEIERRSERLREMVAFSS